jgi:hypothetical protein
MTSRRFLEVKGKGREGRLDEKSKNTTISKGNSGIHSIERMHKRVSNLDWSQQLYKEQFLSVQSFRCVNHTNNMFGNQKVESNILGSNF